MLTVSQLTKSFGGRTLFEDASIQVNRGERIGLVGPNGAGKSTLFSLILGDASPDAGRVALDRGASIGYLPQETADVGEETVLTLATAVSPALAKARAVLVKHDAGGTEAEAIGDDEYHEAMRVFAEENGYQLEAQAKRILHGLAFREVDFERPARTLSGGWIMRAHLARLLVQEPDLLLLDEPTNHLDLESLVWFQEHLRYYPGAILMISHDREFLNQLVDSVVEISRQQLIRYRGNWDAYQIEKAAREEQHASAYKNQQREIASLQEFADRFRAKASKASQAQSKLKQIARMDKLEAPVSAERSVNKFRFPQPGRSGQKVITLENIDFAYGSLRVYEKMNFQAERGQRTVLVGPNGAGKSTLLKLLAGLNEPQAGTREVGHNVKVGYFAQHRVEMLNGRQTVLEAVQDSPNPVGEQIARTVLGSFLFRGDDVFKPVAVLSGGEKSRLALVKLLLDPPNLLLMDEPTTHLDIGSIDALIGALSEYEGTLIFISHDVHFIRKIASTVLHISAGKLVPYAGDYDYYLTKSQAESARSALTAGDKLTDSRPAEETAVKAERGPGMKEQKEAKRAAQEARKAEQKLRREAAQKISNLEMQILNLEGRQKDLTTALEQPEAYEAGGNAINLNRDLAGVTRELQRVTAEWEKLAAVATVAGEDAD
ncbi:MAG TPA: ATP-binding cassette domain-containing protein [Chthoniobacteraceae bacterium]|jgi:ATP-binding cassette subfamily F protein 3|nr:ATP-binding cassette domain-containing protein [Chthoniobacteraceae bacterium]